MIDKRVVIELAKSQIGYHEKATNAQLDDFYANAGNHTWNKYARDLDAIPGFYTGVKNIGDQGHWCDIFVDWCFIKAYGVTIGMQLLCQPWGSAGAGCQYSAQYYERQGRFFVDDPQPGDQIFFDYGGGINHTGIVVDVNQFAIITVEGNADEQVQQCSYPHSANYIAGFGRPNWAMDGEPEPFDPDEPEPEPQEETCDVTSVLPVIRYGDESPWVKAMQALLIGKGYSCGWYGADGEFGTQTKIGLYEFRKAHSLQTDDIICDGEAWSLLLHV